MLLLLLLLARSPQAIPQLPAGQIIPDVKCSADPSQSYALFLPPNYTPERAWPVIFAFDPGGRGRNPVERYQTAATRFGYVVAGSNNSRNGSPQTGAAVASMTADVMSRVHVDLKRIYLAGMSGGARVALGVALGASDKIAGVIASSAGYPDSQPRKTLPFPVFATAGTEDFNHLELRQLDRVLTTPHRLSVFEGGHVWLSSDLAIEAVAWMELQAVKARITSRDEGKIDEMFAKRMAAIKPDVADKETYLSLQAIVVDFEGLKDVSALAVRVAELGRDRAIRAALKKDRDEDDREEATMRDIRTAEARLATSDERIDALAELRRRWRDLSVMARRPDDSADRRLARRVLTGLAAGAPASDADYQQIINEFRFTRGRL
jgi:predicted esterase